MTKSVSNQYVDLKNGTSNGMMELDEEREEDEIMDLDNVPVTQEDAWAVIRYGIAECHLRVQCSTADGLRSQIKILIR